MGGQFLNAPVRTFAICDTIVIPRTAALRNRATSGPSDRDLRHRVVRREPRPPDRRGSWNEP